MCKVPDGKFQKSLICSSTVCGVPSGGRTEVLKRQETSAEKQTPAEYLGSEVLSGNENIMCTRALGTCTHRQLEKPQCNLLYSCTNEN